MKTNRRTFLKQASVLGAAPFILPSNVWAAKVNPSDKIVMGFIGTGKQARGLLGNFLTQASVRVVAVCDVDTTRREAAQQSVNAYYTENPDKGTADCKAYNDFNEIIARTDIDAVCIATPDHWHAFPTIAALESGKDVYCEKPLTHNIYESTAVIKAVKKNNGVLQTGSMQRSSRNFRVACELVRNGAIGDISHVHCSFGDPGKPCDLPEEKMEPGLDWDRWCGGGPIRAYNSVLSPRGNHDHFPDWRSYKEYGGGMVCDWGAHHLDIMQWGLGMDASGPDEARPPAKQGDTRGATLHYGDIVVTHQDGYGIEFYGSGGQVNVNRGRMEFFRDGKQVKAKAESDVNSDINFFEEEYLKNAKVKLYDSKHHIKDFVQAVHARTKPITNEQVGGRSAICCHLMNQTYYNHEAIQWRPKKMKFARGTGNPAWLTREYRGPWSV